GTSPGEALGPGLDRVRLASLRLAGPARAGVGSRLRCLRDGGSRRGEGHALIVAAGPPAVTTRASRSAQASIGVAPAATAASRLIGASCTETATAAWAARAAAPSG